MSTQAKGAVVAATLDYLRTAHGGDTVDTILAHLAPETRAAIGSVRPTDAVPLALIYELWRAADRELHDADPLWMEKAGAHSITSKGVQLYSGIVRKATPLAFLTQPVSLFRLFYHSGDMEVVERSAGRAILRLLDFDDVDVLFCRRQTGGLHRALELAGGENAAARHVRCVTEGDAFCEWELTWTASAAPRAKPQPV
jgi:hypothetical protein